VRDASADRQVYLRNVQFSDLYATAELGKRESLKLNIASLENSKVILNHLHRSIEEVVSPMVKAILLKVHLLLSSSVGIYH
jgi:hypothetical protein